MRQGDAVEIEILVPGSSQPLFLLRSAPEQDCGNRTTDGYRAQQKAHDGRPTEGDRDEQKAHDRRQTSQCRVAPTPPPRAFDAADGPCVDRLAIEEPPQVVG